jgi:hypothetical protein
MGKRSGGRAGDKVRATGKREAAKDLSARKGHAVVGGLLPAIQARPGAQSSDSIPTETVSLNFDKITWK